jgi:hypothetical protein
VGLLPKEIVLYLCRDEQSKKMLQDFQSELNLLPKPDRPKLKVKLVKINDPRDFPSFLQQLEELYGGVYTLEFKKLNIEKLPAIVVDGEKISEGKYLSKEEIRDLLGLPVKIEAGLTPPVSLDEELPQVAPVTSQPKPQPKKEPEPITLPIELEEPETPKPITVTPEKPARQHPVQSPVVTKQPEVPLLGEPAMSKRRQPEEIPTPIELEEPLQEEQPQEEAPITARPTPKAAQEAKPKPEVAPTLPPPPTLPQPIEKPPAVRTKTPQEALPKPPVQQQAKPQTVQEDLKGTCFTCLFYDKDRSKCKLLHIAVQDPYNPPCGRRRPK